VSVMLATGGITLGSTEEGGPNGIPFERNVTVPVGALPPTMVFVGGGLSSAIVAKMVSESPGLNTH
jgi:hypothetical protein